MSDEIQSWSWVVVGRVVKLSHKATHDVVFRRGAAVSPFGTRIINPTNDIHYFTKAKGMTSCPLTSARGLASTYGYVYMLCLKKCHACVFALSVACRF
jgi:hypothetical protein